MVRDTSGPTRKELSERTDGNADAMEVNQENLRKTSEDIQTIRSLIEQLDPGGGTAEGTDEVQQSVESAEGATEQVFDEQDRDLETVTEENEEFRDEVQGRSEVTEANLGRLSEESASIETKEAVAEIRTAKEAALKDIDFLQDLVNQAMERGERNEQIRVELNQIRRRTSG